MGCYVNDPPPKRKRPLENWWGNGPKPDIIWGNKDWADWADRVENEDKLYYDRPNGLPPPPEPRLVRF